MKKFQCFFIPKEGPDYQYCIWIKAKSLQIARNYAYIIELQEGYTGNDVVEVDPDNKELDPHCFFPKEELCVEKTISSFTEGIPQTCLVFSPELEAILEDTKNLTEVFDQKKKELHEREKKTKVRMMDPGQPML